MAENELAKMAQMRATPRNKLMGLLADALGSVRDYANAPNPVMPGGLANQPLSIFSNLLGVPSLATTADRMSYGEPLTNAGKANVPFLKPETADALMMAPLSPRGALAAASMGTGMVDNGILKSMLLYHGSSSGAPIKAIEPGGGVFGGLFASGRPGAAGSHGDAVYRMTVPDEKILMHGADTGAASIDVAKRNFGRELSNDDLLKVADIIDRDKSDIAKIPGHLVNALANKLPGGGYSSPEADASWALQRLRGEMAQSLGYKAVAMSDEHGISYLVNGVTPRPYSQEARSLARGTWKPEEMTGYVRPPISPPPNPARITMDQWRALTETDKSNNIANVSAGNRRDLQELARYKGNENILQILSRNGQPVGK